MSSFAYRLLCGFLIGVGCILPGVSGGVMAVSFGLYRPMLDALCSFPRDIRGNGLFLLPIAMGGGLGILLCAGGLSAAMTRWEHAMLYLFVGLVLGGLPGLWHAAKAHFRPRCLWALLPGLLLLLLSATAGKSPAALALPPFLWLLTGGIYALGTVIPGLSASFLLIRLGWYPLLLEAFSRLQLPQLLFFAAGFTAVTLLTLRTVKLLFDRFPGYAAVGVLGLLAASVLPAVPSPAAGRPLLNLTLLAMGAAVALAMERLGQKR